MLEIVTDYLAAGLNPQTSIIYTQSSVPEIAELALYLSMVQSKNGLESLPTLKDLIKKEEYVSLGHLSYPVLMAADILGPKATLVPVGLDQSSNVELAAALARKFNNTYGTKLVIPKMGIRKLKVPGLSGGKMGKSESDQSVGMDDDLNTIIAKYSKFGVTDTAKVLKNSPGNPNNCVSVFPVHKILHESQPELLSAIESGCRSGNLGCRLCKEQLAKSLSETLKPFQEKRRELAEKKDFVKEVIHYGGLRVREIVRSTVEEIKDALGIISY